MFRDRMENRSSYPLKNKFLENLVKIIEDRSNKTTLTSDNTKCVGQKLITFSECVYFITIQQHTKFDQNLTVKFRDRLGIRSSGPLKNLKITDYYEI